MRQGDRHLHMVGILFALHSGVGQSLRYEQKYVNFDPKNKSELLLLLLKALVAIGSLFTFKLYFLNGGEWV